MKKCNVYCSNGSFLAAFLSEDHRVLFDFCREDTAADPHTTPAAVIDGQNYYLPKDAIDACNESSYVLLPFELNGKWGYCDRWMGEVVHEPKWGWCGHFKPVPQGREGARFNAAEDTGFYSDRLWIDEFDPNSSEYDDRWGLVDLDGKEIIAPVYQYLSPIKEGVMLAKKGGRWGAVDTSGKIVLPIEFDDICFLDGFGFVTRKGECFSVYHSSGLPLIEDLPAMPQRWDQGFPRWIAFYAGGWDDFELESNRLYRWASKADTCMWYEYNGLYTVLRCIKGENRMPASIGKYGQPCKSFAEAELVLDAAFESTARIICSRAERMRWNGAKNCDRLPSVTNFANICRVTADGKWGYCNLRTGEIQQLPVWSFFEPFHKADGKYHYVARFDQAPGSTRDCDYQDKFFSDEQDIHNGRWGLIGLPGNIIAPPIYQYLSPMICEYYYIAKKDDCWGILDAYGKTVVPFRYTGICTSPSRECLFLLREGTGDEATYTMLDYDLKVLRSGLTQMYKEVYFRVAMQESEELCRRCLNDPSLQKLTKEEEDYLLSELQHWAISCRYRELYSSYELMLRHARNTLEGVRERNAQRKVDEFHTGTIGKPCRVYYAKCCGSIVNPEQYAVWYDCLPKWEFLDAVMTEDGYIRVVERTPLIHQNVIRYVTPDDAHALGGTTAPYSFECDGQWGYCFENGEILAYPVAGFCDGMPHTDNAGFYVNDNPVMRFSLDSWTHFEIGDFYEGDQTGKKNDFTNGRWGALDCNGYVVIPPVYQYLGRSGKNTDLVIAKKDGFWGALDGNGDVIVPFVWDDIWLDVTYGCIAKKNTRHGERYAILAEEGTVLIGDLPSAPIHLDEYYDRSFKDGDDARVLRCLLQYVHGEDRVLIGHKRYSRYSEAKNGMKGVFTYEEEKIDEE